MSDAPAGGDAASDAAHRSFRSLVSAADRKFAAVRDLPPHCHSPHLLHYYRKVFKAYTRLWRFQQERRRELVAAGLRRWEIGEIASRIGQLFYGQYVRTSEVRFLLESYVFYEAILSRGYLEAGRGSDASSSSSMPDLGLRYKELRFLVVAMLLSRKDAAKHLVDRLRGPRFRKHISIYSWIFSVAFIMFKETSFKEWRQILQEIVKFLNADAAFASARPFRYSLVFDSHPSSHLYIARFHAKRVLKLKDALLTSYHRNEVKFTELTLDTYRMLQCLEWEPSGSFYQLPTTEASANGASSDHDGASGLIDINLAADMTDPTLPPNPRKAILYHPSVSHLIAVLAMISEELSHDSILLIYISASGKADQNTALQKESYRSSTYSTNLDPLLRNQGSTQHSGSYLCLGSRGGEGLSNLYPDDIIPFTRRPLFLVIDSDNSHAFKAIHGAERGEAAALLLSPGISSSLCSKDLTPNGSQFTYFLTAPLLAFFQLLGLSTDIDADTHSNIDSLLSSALAEWEVILCTSDTLDQVWSQVLRDHFLRRLIVRFIFCRAVLFLIRPLGKDNRYIPDCLPKLPDSTSPTSAAVQSCIYHLAHHFEFSDDLKGSTHCR